MKFIFGYLLIVGTIFSFLIPPFQKPDETVHFKKALAVSYGVFNCPQNNKLLIPKHFKNLIENNYFQSIISKKNRKLNLQNYLNSVIYEKPSKIQESISINQICQLPAISYFLYTPGLIISRFLHLNQYLSFFLGRFFGFFIFFIWFYFLYKSCPKSIRSIILLTFFLPMTLHQLTAYSYDGLQIMCSLTIFIGLLKIIENKVQNKKIWILIILLCVAGILFGRTRIKVSDPIGLQPDKQLTFLINNPVFFSVLIFNSTLVHFIFYAQGLIGIFGWLEYGLSPFVYFIFVVVIGYTIISIKLPKKIVLNNLYLLILTLEIFFGYLFILTINYLRWTPYKATITEGVQGRYFIILFPYFIYWLVNLKNKYLPRLIFRLKIPPWLINFFIIFISFLIFRNIFMRFYL